MDGPEGSTVLLVAGELDPSTAPELARRVQEAIDTGGGVVLDLADVTFMDSSGIAVLIAAHQSLRSGGRNLLLRRPNAVVRRVLEIAQLTGELSIE